MRKIIFLLPFLAVSLLLTSCNNLHREFHDFPNYQWGRFDKVTFNFNIEKEGTTADIILYVRHLEQIPYEMIPMSIVMKLPSGEERILEHEFMLKDANGKFTGDVAGSFWDVERTIWKDFNFNTAGTYTIEVEHVVPRPSIPAMVDLGLIVRKS